MTFPELYLPGIAFWVPMSAERRRLDGTLVLIAAGRGYARQCGAELLRAPLCAGSTVIAFMVALRPCEWSEDQAWQSQMGLALRAGGPKH